MRSSAAYAYGRSRRSSAGEMRTSPGREPVIAAPKRVVIRSESRRGLILASKASPLNKTNRGTTPRKVLSTLNHMATVPRWSNKGRRHFHALVAGNRCCAVGRLPSTGRGWREYPPFCLLPRDHAVPTKDKRSRAKRFVEDPQERSRIVVPPSVSIEWGHNRRFRFYSPWGFSSRLHLLHSSTTASARSSGVPASMSAKTMSHGA